ncbi:hypothetical protein ZHAS_00017547 [Anopheles sinensis]|uniref:Cu2_monoox_C domain-containing protein n=1 Tax=Anopheles sinensis TaxID=74873 RepID=A0A084WGU7_ANOSI|nr:hypothetical protein ZHAS_00017547 [Anopheles sinensis]
MGSLTLSGFTFPSEAGYPLESHQATYYMLETHYNYPDYTYDFSPFYRKNLSKQQRNMNIASRDETVEPSVDDSDDLPEDEDGTMMEQQMVDNSGLKMYYTHKLRQYDAGVLSVGLDPNWRHIIPPRQEKVVSEGHCIGACTQRAFPREGINIFAVMSRTHLIGRQVKLRQVRGNAELQPIMHDTNIDPSYQDYRRLAAPAKVLPGDSLVAECIYDSSSRKSITLGGMTTREEICLILTLYYPRQRELTSCHSLPSLPTVLHSLGIEELASEPEASGPADGGHAPCDFGELVPAIRSKSGDLLRKETPSFSAEWAKSFNKMSHFNSLKQWGINRLRMINRESSNRDQKDHDIDDFNIHDTTLARQQSATGVAVVPVELVAPETWNHFRQTLSVRRPLDDGKASGK